jgi:hypothetical protein
MTLISQSHAHIFHPSLILYPRWLYTFFVSLDGCFKLKLKARGIKDPDMSLGWAYFVKTDEYEKFMSLVGEVLEVCMLSAFGV